MEGHGSSPDGEQESDINGERRTRIIIMIEFVKGNLNVQRVEQMFHFPFSLFYMYFYRTSSCGCPSLPNIIHPSRRSSSRDVAVSTSAA